MQGSHQDRQKSCVLINNILQPGNVGINYDTHMASTLQIQSKGETGTKTIILFTERPWYSIVETTPQSTSSPEKAHSL